MNEFHQLAIYHPDPESAVSKLEMAGYPEWTYDSARLVGEVYGQPFETLGQMWFCYQLTGKEFEFLRYQGPSWHSANGRTDEKGNCHKPFLSHLSTHVENIEETRKELEGDGLVVAQSFETFDHVNPYLRERKQRFKEVIFETRQMFGFDLKYMERIYDV